MSSRPTLNEIEPYHYDQDTKIIKFVLRLFTTFSYYIETGLVEYRYSALTNSSLIMKYKTIAKEIESYGQFRILTHFVKHLEVRDICTKKLSKIKAIQKYSKEQLDEHIPSVLSQLIVDYMY